MNLQQQDSESATSLSAANVQARQDEVSYHHYSLTFDPNDVSHRFKQVRFILVAGSAHRAEAHAKFLAEELFNGSNLSNFQLEHLTASKSRFTLFQVGPVLISDHGMGAASMSIALHELFLMCKQANILKNITMIRFGTCKYTLISVSEQVFRRKLTFGSSNPRWWNRCLARHCLCDQSGA